MTKNIPLIFGNRVYPVPMTAELLMEMEYELGGLAEIAEKFARAQWRFTDLVAIVQMMLQATGRTVDFMYLGNQIMNEGIQNYVSAVQKLLDAALLSEKEKRKAA